MTDLQYIWLNLRMHIGIKLLSAALSIWPEGWGKKELAKAIYDAVGVE